MTSLCINKTPEHRTDIADRNRRDRYQRSIGLAVCEFECNLVPYCPTIVGFYRSNLEPGHYYGVIVAQTIDRFFNRTLDKNQPHFFSSKEEREAYIEKRIKTWSRKK